MIRINRQTDYAFRVILFLAKHPPSTRVSSAKIRDEMLIPPALSQRIIADLARGEFIQTFPGRDGGIQLGKRPEDISLWDIFELFEGPIYLSECLVEGQECPFENQCPVRRRWEPLQNIIVNELKKVSFKELALEAKASEIMAFAST